MNKLAKTGLLCALGVVGMCGLVGPLVMLSTGLQAFSKLEVEKASARQTGMPLDLSNIPEHPVPPDKNAAVLYAKIHSLDQEIEARSMNKQLAWLESATHEAIPSKSAGNMRTEADIRRERETRLRDFNSIFDLVRKLDSASECDFGDGWFKHPYSESLFWTHTLSQALRDEADLDDRRGDWREALAWLRYLLRIAHDAGTEPTIAAWSTEVNLRGQAIGALEELLARHTHDAAFLGAVDSQLQPLGPISGLRTHAAGEIVSFRRIMQTTNSIPEDETKTDLDEGDVADPRTPSSAEIQKSYNDSRAGQIEQMRVKSLALASVREEMDARWISAWLIAWPFLSDDSDQWESHARGLAAANSKEQQDRSPINSLNREMFASYVDAPDGYSGLAFREAHLLTRERLLRVSVWLLRARLSSGKLPLSLPADLGAVMVDPFSGQPMHYRRQASGFILYSVGKDGVDNGGTRLALKGPSRSEFDEVVEFK